MPKFYFNLTDGTHTLQDNHGVDLPSVVDARRRVKHASQDVIADLHPVILVTDEAGRHVYAAGFSPLNGAQDPGEHQELLSETERLARIGGWKLVIGTKALILTEGAYRVLGFPFDQAATAADCLATITPDSRRRLKRAIVRSIREDRSFDVEVAFAVDGANDRLRVFGHAKTMLNGPLEVYGIVNAIEKNESIDLVWDLANHDGLTGLANRALFQKQLEVALTRARNARTKLALVILDLDHLKETNDTLGHPVGDALLRLVANRLRSSIRVGDFAARIGGDEFALILVGLSDASEVAALVDSVQTRLQQPFEHSGRTISSGASAGISIFPDHDDNAEGLLKNADIALHVAKSIGRGSLTLYSREMGMRLEKRMEGVTNARAAVLEGQILPYYQPQISTKTQTIVGFEALLRWNHPTKGVLLPGAIEAAFEDRELSAAIGESLLQDILDDISQWTSQNLSFGRIAFNASRTELIRPRYASDLLHHIELASVDPRILELEVHEDALAGRGSERVEAALREMHEAGVALALDDFGTGYGSLNHLRRLPIDELKIDHSFVSVMHDEPFAKAIVCALIKMTTSMNLRLVAEGVETAEQMRFLSDEGCDILQGFYFAPAIPAEDVPGFIQDWSVKKISYRDRAKQA